MTSEKKKRATTRAERNSHASKKDLVSMYLENDVIKNFKEYEHLTSEEMYKHLKASGQLYSPVYCMGLIQHMEEGRTFQSFAAEVNISTNTLYRWCTSHPEFGEARDLGHSKALAYWEEILHKAITKDTEADAKLLIIKLKNEYKQFYVESEDAAHKPTEIHIHTGIEQVHVDDSIVADFTSALVESGYEVEEDDGSGFASKLEAPSTEPFEFIDPADFSGNTVKEKAKVKDEDLL